MREKEAGRLLLRVWALILALALGPGALASVYVVNAGGVAALVDGGGAPLLEGELGAAFEVRPGALYAAGEPGAYDLYDAAGTRLFGPFEMIEDMGGPLVFRRGGLYGAVDGAGELMLLPEWTQLTWGGGFLALEGNPLDEQPDEVLSLSDDGEARPTGITTESGLAPFHGGLMVFRAPDGRYGALNGAGEAVIPAEWAFIADFVDGAAIVSDGAMYGLIGPEGQVLAATAYVWLQRGERGLFGLREDGALDLLAPDGRVTATIDDLDGPVSVAGQCVAAGGTLYGPDGAAVYSGSGEALFFPGLDGQTVVSDGPWGSACEQLLNPDGRPVSEKYPRILPLAAERYAFITFGDDFADPRCGLLDAAGHERLPPDYREILPTGKDRLVLLTDEAVLFADMDGNVLRRWERVEHE